MEINNKKLENLIGEINHVSLNHEDLLAACLEFSKLYFKKDKKTEQDFEKFWDSYFFIEQLCISSREAIVLGLHSLTLAEDIDFVIIMDRCINLEMQQKNLHELTKNITEKDKLIVFFDSLRKELFSRIYSQNKSLQKITEIHPDILSKRYDVFMEKIFK